MNGRILYLVAAVGALLMLIGGFFGPWWLSFLGAVVIGAAIPRALAGIVEGAFFGLAGWAIPLAVIQSRYGLAPTAGALAAILGFKGAPAIPLVLTLLVGLLLGASGAWLGAAARAVVITRPWSRPVQKLGDQRLEVKDSVLTKS